MARRTTKLPPTDQAKFWRLPAVIAFTQRSRSAILRAVEEGTFPRPVALGPRTRAWVAAEVRAWGEQQIAASRAGERQ